MGNIGDTITQPIPVVGTSGTAYATQINAFLTEVKARLEAAIPVGSLLVGNLDLNNNALFGASYVGLYQNTTPDTGATGSLQNINGDLYYIDSTGAIQLTTGGTINSSGIGGITGDYGGANPAQLRFDDGSKVYQHYDDFSGLAWAYTRQLGVDIAGSSTSLVRARITWAGASSMSIILPAALPATTVLLQMDNAGQISATNTLPVNTDITLSGTGKIVNGTRSITGDFSTVYSATGGTLSLGMVGDSPVWTGSSGVVAYIRLPYLEANAAVTTVSVYSNAGSNPTLQLFTENGSLPTGSTGIAGSTSGTTGFGQRKTTLTVTTPAVYAEPYYILKLTNIASSVSYSKITVTYTVPA
jgi:hypothetical protein